MYGQKKGNTNRQTELNFISFMVSICFGFSEKRCRQLKIRKKDN